MNASKKTTRDSVIITPGRPKEASEKSTSGDETPYGSFFENAVVGIFKSTIDGKLTEANPALAEMMGYGSPNQMLTEVAETTSLYANPESRKTIIKAALAKGGKLVRWEEPMRRKDGRVFTASSNIRVIFDEYGSPTHIEGFVEDVSDQKRMHEAIRESEERFRGIFEESPIGISLFDDLGRLINTNQACLDIFGVHNSSEVVGSRLFDIPYLSEKARQSLNGGRTIRKDVQFDFDEINRLGIFSSSKKGASYLDISIKPLCNEEEKPPTGFLMFVLDISERKRMMESLIDIEKQQNAILDNIPDIAWLKDRESRFIQVNEPFGKACGRSPKDLVGKTDLDIWPNELAERYRADDREVMSSGKRKQVEEPLSDSGGRNSWIETIKTPIYNVKGEVIGTTGIARDITERKRMEDELARTKHELEVRVAQLMEELEKAKSGQMQKHEKRQIVQDMIQKRLE